jgi:hypothetical protein
MTDITRKIGHCRNCKVNREFLLHVQIFANASENFLWVCPVCNVQNPGADRQFYLPSEFIRRSLSAEQVEALPKILPSLYTRCACCGNRTAKIHHWAPKGIFGDAEANLWPTDYLCKSCHGQWHRLVTPQLVQP